jgi:hypothetical protein
MAIYSPKMTPTEMDWCQSNGIPIADGWCQLPVSYLPLSSLRVLVRGKGEVAESILAKCKVFSESRKRFIASLAENPLGDFYSLSK